jgi:hypothetical protein
LKRSEFMGTDYEWNQMLADYLRRVPKPAFKEQPPLKTRLEEQLSHEEPEIDSE